VQAATRACAAGRPAEALDLLDAYALEFPHGVLAREAGLVRVKALAGAGNREAARDLARTLLDADPRGVLAAPLAAILRDLDQDGGS
jgi:hypothetical protein